VKRGRGRPPKGDDALTEGIEVRFSRQDRADVTEAAEFDGVAFSTWIREAAIEKAHRRLAKGRK
jgi:uncharacterized protein (DUF1778 family)